MCEFEYTFHLQTHIILMKTHAQNSDNASAIIFFQVCTKVWWVGIRGIEGIQISKSL